MNFNPFGEDARFHHAGIALKSIAEQFPDAEIIHDPIQNVNIAFANMHGITIELVEPVNEKSPVHRYIQSKQNLYHLCFEHKDLEFACENARAHRFHAVSKPVPAVAFGGRKIVWFFHKDLGLYELLEG